MNNQTKDETMKKNNGFAPLYVLLSLLIPVVILAIIGWVKNVIALGHIDAANHIGMLIVRVIGLFMAPLGAILGWI